jgi:hypothetical protein
MERSAGEILRLKVSIDEGASRSASKPDSASKRQVVGGQASKGDEACVSDEVTDTSSH